MDKQKQLSNFSFSICGSYLELHNCRLATAWLNIVEEKAYDFCCCDTNNYKPQVNYLTESLWSVASIVIIIK